MSQKKTLHSFFQRAQGKSADPSESLEDTQKRLVQNYTPSPLLSASSRLNQMPKLTRKAGSEQPAKRKTEGRGVVLEEPVFKQPKLAQNEKERRTRLLQGLGDGTIQEANLKCVSKVSDIPSSE